MKGIIHKFFSLFLLSMAITGLTAWTAQATSMTTTVTGVVTRAAHGNPFDLFAVGDQIFADVMYEDSLISSVGQSLLSVDTDPSFTFSVMIGPSFQLDLSDFSQGNNNRNRSPELTFHDGALSGIEFSWEHPFSGFQIDSFQVSSGQIFQAATYHSLLERTLWLEGKWEFPNTDGDPTGNTPVPEPSTLLLFGSGLVGVVVWRWRQKGLSLTS